jgi:predicted component of type VI protein secretion system
MAKLFLKFEQTVLKEVTLGHGVLTIGRLPDNGLQVDNPAVSSHHAKIFWDQGHYVVEDNNSLNGTYVNNRRVSRAHLRDKDQVLIGKHTIAFEDEYQEGAAVEPAVEEPERKGPELPKMEATMMLDTKKAKEMLAQAKAMAAAAPAPPADKTAEVQAAAPPQERIGMFTVIEGKVSESQYSLTSKLTIIGKSDQATIRLKGWFAPAVAAIVRRAEHNKYFLAPQDKSAKVKINGADVAGQKELQQNDTVEVAGVKFTFNLVE